MKFIQKLLIIIALLIFISAISVVVVLLTTKNKYYKCDSQGNCVLDTKGTQYKNDPTCGETCKIPSPQYCEKGKWSHTGLKPCVDCTPESKCNSGVLSACTATHDTVCKSAPLPGGGKSFW